ncbi:MAG TPA: hypothetical protein V6C76_08140 [Drouetiella sp.]
MNRSLIPMALLVLVAYAAPRAVAETREESAAQLIAQNAAFKQQAQQLHGSAEKSISNANRLAGEAHSLVLKAGTPQFKTAVAQYSGDLALFRAHAEQYNAHLDDFRKTVGECHAGEAAYEASLKSYQLHVDMFHVPNLNSVKPPHICRNMQMSQDEATRLAYSMRNDQLRVLKAENNLNMEEQKLAQAKAAEMLNEKKAVNAAIRDKREQLLAGEFGKLKEEYDLLKVENQALGGPSSKVVAAVGAQTSVSAKLAGH